MSDTKQLGYDWYQSDSQVVITLMQKNVKAEDLTVDFKEQGLDVTIKIADQDGHSCLSLQLAHPIITADSNFRLSPFKVEIKLRKKEAIFWNKLQGADPLADLQKSAVSNASGDNGAKAPVDSKVYPSSSRHPKNWDHIAQEVAKDTEEEGDALNNLFQKIFADGTDETKKAMMKSFTESSGTVLSTNWGDVKKEKVDVKPPDGMEYKHYE